MNRVSGVLYVALMSLTSDPILPASARAGLIDQPASKSADTLSPKIGSPAPALACDVWVKGVSRAALEPGKAHVLVFWATWCGPCIAEMPVLSRLQRQFSEKGVSVIGVNIWEDKVREETSVDREARVRQFVEAQGDRMSYDVALCEPSARMAAWYERAERGKGIPFCVVVNKEGIVVWAGHPVWLVEVLDLVATSRWNLDMDPGRFEAADAMLNWVFDKLASGDVGGAKTDWTTFESAHPAVAVEMGRILFPVFLQVGEHETAYALARKSLRLAAADRDVPVLNAIAWSIVDPDRPVAVRDLDLALEAAAAGVALSQSPDPAVLDTLARVQFTRGEPAMALAIQERAIDLVPPGPAREKLLATAKQYRAAQSR